MATPWRNGGGATLELAAEPAEASLDDFTWRVSIATVDSAGPFSAFAGVDRIIALLNGGSMRLTVDGLLHDLQPLQPFSFAGEAVIVCELPGVATRDLNVMTRRGVVSASLTFLHVDAAEVAVRPAWRRVVVTVSGHLEATFPTHGSVQLGALDGLVDDRPELLIVRGSGTLAVVRLTTSG
jgi:uncharacterized protein